MWDLTCLIILQTIVFVISINGDDLNTFLTRVKSEKFQEPQQSTGFITKVSASKLVIDGLEKVEFTNGSQEVELDFIFPYASRKTKSVTIKRDGVLLLRDKIGDADLITPIPQANLTSDDKSIVEYHKTDDYFIVKWSDLEVIRDNSNKAIYNVAIIIYKSGEILIVYGQLSDVNSDPIQILKYHKITSLNTYEYFGPELNSSDIASDSVVYIKEGEPNVDLSAMSSSTIEGDFFTDGSSTVTEQSTSETELDTTTELTTTEPISTKPSPIQNLEQNARRKLIESDVQMTTSVNNLISSFKPIYEQNASRANTLFDAIDSSNNSTQILVKNQQIPFNLSLNNVQFRTVTIEPKGKILLNGPPNESSQIQLEPIPHTDDVEVKSLELKYLADDDQLIILLNNLKVKSKIITSFGNKVLLVLNKSGTIEIIYKCLVNPDINGKEMIMYTSSKSSDDVVGEVDFTKIKNGTIVSFGRVLNTSDPPLLLSDPINKFNNVSLPNLVFGEMDSGTIVHITSKQVGNISILQLTDEVASSVVELNPRHISKGLNRPLVEQFERATTDYTRIDINNKNTFSVDLPFELCQGLKTVRVTDTMELYIGENKKITLVPSIPGKHIPDTRYQLINQTDFVAIQWDELNIGNITYKLRVFIYQDGNVIVLYPNVTSPSTMTNRFVDESDVIELESGTIVKIYVCDVKPILFDDLLSLIPTNWDDCANNTLFKMIDDAKLHTYMTLSPDTTQVKEDESKSVTITPEFDIIFNNETKVNSISVSDSVLLHLQGMPIINLVPTENGDYFNIEADLRITTRPDYVTMTWNNLIVKTNGSRTSIYNKIRVVIFPTGNIMIMYDIDRIVPHEFLTGLKPIDLQRGLVVRIDSCTLTDLELPKTICDLLAEFNGTINDIKHFTDYELEQYFAFSPDSAVAPCSNGICTVESRFDIPYGDAEIRTIYIADNMRMYFEASAYLDLVSTDDANRTNIDGFYYNANDEYVSMTWHNLTVVENRTYNMRVVIFPEGDVIVLYRITMNGESDSRVNEMARIMGTVAGNRDIIKTTTNEIYQHFRPKVLLAEVKSANQKPDSCVTQINDVNGIFIKTLYAIKNDTKALSAGQREIQMKYKIEIDDTAHQGITIKKRTRFYFDVPSQIYDFTPFGYVTKDEKSFKISYETTSEYTSISLTNVTFIKAEQYQVTIDGRAIIYPTGDIIFGYKYISVPRKIELDGTTIDITNGTIILAQVRHCQKTNGKTFVAPPPQDGRLISSANGIGFSYFTGLVLGLSLVKSIVNHWLR